MSQFIQLHMLTFYGPSNLNRDDLGRPKTVRVGNAERLRISSQSLKRAWRTSDLFEEVVKENKGIRTKLLGVKVYEKMTNAGITSEKARTRAQLIAQQFGKLKKAKKDSPQNDLEIEQLVHISPTEWDITMALADKLIEQDRDPNVSELNILRKNISAIDVALFGRMLAKTPSFNIEAAAQVSHAFTVHAAVVEDDYFTAVDDLNTKEKDTGSAHIGELGFGSGLFYTYVCINKDLLSDNLKDDALTEMALRGITTSAAQIAPTGKQNSFASRARASYVMAEKGKQQPRQLSSAFIKPISGLGLLQNAVQELERIQNNMDAVYGICAEERYVLNVDEQKGSLNELIDFVRS
jgi:CRISPR system Cascade subunit CasC